MFPGQQTLSPERIRWIQYIACALLAGWLLIRGVLPGWSNLHSDFGNYYVSARLVMEGSNLDSLYDNAWFQGQMARLGVSTPGKFAPFPPITSWVMLPLTWLSPLDAQRAFTLVNLGFVVVLVYGWKRITGWDWIISTLVVLLSGLSLANNIAFGQLYVLVAACTLLSVSLVERGNALGAGVILGVVSTVKYYPVVVVVGLAALFSLDRSRRTDLLTILYFVLTVVIMIAAQFAFFGAEVMGRYFTTALLPHLASDLRGQGMHSYLFQSWDSLGRNLFVYDPTQNTAPWIDWPQGRIVLKTIVTVLVILTTAAVMFVNRRSLHRSQIFLAMPALGAIVLLPASATYHHILLLLPIGLLIRENALTRKRMWMSLALYALIGFIPYNLFFQLADSAGLIFAYPRLWLVALLFIIVARGLFRWPKSVA